MRGKWEEGWWWWGKRVVVLGRWRWEGGAWRQRKLIKDGDSEADVLGCRDDLILPAAVSGGKHQQSQSVSWFSVDMHNQSASRR